MQEPCAGMGRWSQFTSVGLASGLTLCFSRAHDEEENVFGQPRTERTFKYSLPSSFLGGEGACSWSLQTEYLWGESVLGIKTKPFRHGLLHGGLLHSCKSAFPSVAKVSKIWLFSSRCTCRCGGAWFSWNWESYTKQFLSDGSTFTLSEIWYNCSHFQSPMGRKTLKRLVDCGTEEELVGFYVKWFCVCENSHWFLLKKYM